MEEEELHFWKALLALLYGILQTVRDCLVKCLERSSRLNVCQFESLRTYGLNYVYSRTQNVLFVSTPAGLNIDHEAVKNI